MSTGSVGSKGKGKASELADKPDSSPGNTVADVGLSVVYESVEATPVVEIVFVHGLQGHPFKTWACPVGGAHSQAKHRKTVSWSDHGEKPEASTEEQHSYAFWPRNFLPQKCPRARIWVFGYDTIVAKLPFTGAANQNSIFAHSKTLANELSRHLERGRPIVFVAHSLGGIIVKDMLTICSTSNFEGFLDVVKCTRGIVFLGTPHRGSWVAGIGKIARKAASLVLMDTNQRILDSLSLKNSDLERCQESFSSLWQKYRFSVKTFQEGQPLKQPFRLGYLNKSKIVPDTSSCLGDFRERAELLDADHREMCRYGNMSDPNYEKVSGELQAIYRTLLSTNKSMLSELPSKQQLGLFTKEVVNSLQFPEMNRREHAIKLPAENTCDWLFTNPVFLDWSTRQHIDKNFGLVQIIGHPGSGKSTLMKKTSEQLKAQHKDDGTCIVGFFFNSRGQELERTTTGLFRSLLHQLVTQNPVILSLPITDMLDELHLRKMWHSSTNRDELSNILTLIFSGYHAAPKRTIILIDALDECVDAAWTGYFFADLTKTAYKAGVQLEVCLTRREFPPITLRNSLEINMESYNTADIQCYNRQKLGLMPLSPADADILQNRITQRSRGIFLWVVLVVEDILEDIESGKNVQLILRRTMNPPKALDDLFVTLLSKIDAKDREVALSVFQWAILAEAPLRLREWHHILAFCHTPGPSSLHEWRLSDYYTENNDQLERQIRYLTQGLVEFKSGTEIPPVDLPEPTSDDKSLAATAGSLDSTMGESRPVQLIHETVAQFFISGKANKLFGRAATYDFVGEGHLAIVNTCLDYIGLSELDDFVAARLTMLSRASKSRHPLHRHQSIASFMSSASSHSGGRRSIHNSHDPDSSDEEPVRASPEPTHKWPSSVNSSESDLQWLTQLRVLEDYPALLSYAVNRVFDHAHAIQEHHISLKRIFYKLINEGLWSRWKALQEGRTSCETWPEFAEEEGFQEWYDAL